MNVILGKFKMVVVVCLPESATGITISKIKDRVGS